MLTGTYYTCVFDMPNSVDEGARGGRPDESLTSSDSEKEVCMCVCVYVCVCAYVRSFVGVCTVVPSECMLTGV